MIAAKEEIRVAYGLLTSISQDEDERARFRARRKFQMDLEHNRIVSFEEGKDEGRMEERTEVARNMLTDGLPVEKVVQYTRLSREEIEKLRT
jgi:predicted transposase/invertase (TIGR01784 family)